MSGAWIFAADGVASRIVLTPPSATILFAPYPHIIKDDNCESRYAELGNIAWSCRLSKSQMPDIAIIGDSHAHQY